MNINQKIFEFIFSFTGKSPVFDAFGTFLAEYLPFFLVFGLFFFLVEYRKWRERGVVIAFVLFNLILARGILAYILSFFFPVARPFVTLDLTPLVGSAAIASFPSTYATIFFSLGFSLYALKRPWGVVYILAACAVGLGRIFVGVNWPLDVLGGILVALVATGISWLMFMPYIEKLLFPKES